MFRDVRVGFKLGVIIANLVADGAPTDFFLVMHFPYLTGLVSVAALAASALGASVPMGEIQKRQASEKYVFAHFIVSDRL